MARFYIQFNYGSGFVTVDPQDVTLKLKLVRGEINEYVVRKALSGTFSLIGTEATTAKTYFITGGNYEAPIKIYENTTSAVLKYEGFAKITGEYDSTQNKITFNSFRTNDAYTGILEVLEDEQIGELLTWTGGFRNFALQGNATNCNELQAYSWSGTVWATTGNPLSLANIGRVVTEPLGASIVVYDNVSLEIRRYVYSAPNWALSVLGTSYFMPVGSGNGAMAAYTATDIAYIDDGLNELYFLALATGTFTVTSQKFVENISLPSLAYIGGSNRIALVDDGTKVLRTYSITGTQIGETLSLGNISKPQICALDGTNFRIALVDSATHTLRCYEWSGAAWSELGANIVLPAGYEIKITQTTVNEVNVFDAISGYFEKYTFSGTAWTKTGNTTTLSGGYMAAGAYDSSVMGVIQSDTYAFECSIFSNVFLMLTALLDDFYPSLSIDSSGNGSTVDLEKLCLGDLGDLRELSSEVCPLNKFKFSLKFVFDLLEKIFQNYWYIDTSTNKIKFIQPASFSLVGTDITLPSLIATNLNQVTYSEGFNISKEDITFNNQRGSDFEGLKIDYERNSSVIEESAINVTTDLGYFVDTLMGTDSNFKNSGLFMIYGENDANVRFIVTSGTGILATSNIKNYYMSKSQIQNDYWKDYRYGNTGNITINGSSSAVQDTVRDIIQYPDISVGEDQISLTEFPDTIGSVIWGGGKISWITELSIDINSLIITIRNRLLDL